MKNMPARNRALRASQISPQLAAQPVKPQISSFEEELTEIGRSAQQERSNSKLQQLQRLDAADEQLSDDEVEESQHETATGKPIHVPYTPDLRSKLQTSTALHTHTVQKPMVLRDYQLLAEACQRAGRARMEGHAYYKIGELLAKNKRDTLAKSVTYFKRYLSISRRLNDLQGEAKALNCLGIVHYELGGEQNLHVALEYHRQHAEIADAAGIFIANTNMGLCHSKLNSLQSAIECHKQALQYAVRAGDKAAESLALANLGQTGTKQGDLTTARVCVERHLELATNLRDNSASCEAYEQLGVLATQRNDFATASENFLLALNIAVRDNDQVRARYLRCQVGYTQGMLRMEEQMKTSASAMGGQVGGR